LTSLHNPFSQPTIDQKAAEVGLNLFMETEHLFLAQKNPITLAL